MKLKILLLNASYTTKIVVYDCKLNKLYQGTAGGIYETSLIEKRCKLYSIVNERLEIIVY